MMRSPASSWSSSSRFSFVYYHYYYLVLLLLSNHYFLKSSAIINHYTTVGMPSMVEGPSDDPGTNMVESSKSILENGKNCYKVPIEHLQDDDCFYYLVSSKSGAQLWGGVQRNSFVGFDPHFKGKSRERILLLGLQNGGADLEEGEIAFSGQCMAIWDYPESGLEAFFADKSNYLEPSSIAGVDRVEKVFADHDDEESNYLQSTSVTSVDALAFHKTVAVGDDDGRVLTAGFGFTDPKTRNMHCAFDFACPHVACIPKTLQLPAKATLQLTAFAENELTTFDSVEEYLESTKGEKGAFASKSFCAGSFQQDDPTYTKGRDYALIAGHVVEVEKRTNELTGKSFYWVLLSTAGDVQIDLVIDEALPEQLDIKVPKVGGVVHGFFWLSGYLYID